MVSYMFDSEWILITRMQLMCVCRCEHYSMRLGGMRNHLFSYEVGNGLYDMDYLEALFDDDEDEIRRFESTAQKKGYGPLVACSTIANHNSIKVNCRMLHLYHEFVMNAHILIQLVNIVMTMGNSFLLKWSMSNAIVHSGSTNHLKNIGMHAQKYS